MAKIRYAGEMSERAIAGWMRAHVEEHFDGVDVNLTTLVEAWDYECASGGDTLDETHPAWDVAVRVADGFEKSRESAS